MGLIFNKHVGLQNEEAGLAVSSPLPSVTQPASPVRLGNHVVCSAGK